MIKSQKAREMLLLKEREREQIEKEIREKVAAEQLTNVTFTASSATNFSTVITTSGGWFIATP